MNEVNPNDGPEVVKNVGSGHRFSAEQMAAFDLEVVIARLKGIAEDRSTTSVVVYLLLCLILVLVIMLVYRQVSCFKLTYLLQVKNAKARRKKVKKCKNYVFSMFQLSGCIKICLSPLCCPVMVLHFVLGCCSDCFLPVFEKMMSPVMYAFFTEQSPQTSDVEIGKEVISGPSKDDAVPSSLSRPRLNHLGDRRRAKPAPEDVSFCE